MLVPNDGNKHTRRALGADKEAPEDSDAYQLKEFDRRMLERRKRGSRQQLPAEEQQLQDKHRNEDEKR